MMKKYHFEFDVMSTPCEVLLYCDDPLKAEEVAKSILLEAKRLEKKYNYFDETSLLSQINTRKTQDLDAETKGLLQRAKQYYTATHGVFDITVATIKDLYRKLKDVQQLQKEIIHLKPYVGCEHFVIKRQKIIFDNPYTKIDLGGFVKEYAVDQTVKIVKKAKITSALINFGGDIYALGNKPNGEPFTIGIKDPADPTRHARTVALHDQALTTSASYERNYTVDTQTFSHIISTTTAVPLSGSVTVIASNCVESGVFSTALMINKNIPTNNSVIFL